MRKVKRNRIKTEPVGKSLTHQSEHDRSEINRIVKKGIIPPDPNQLQFGDFSGGEDFREIQNRIIEVNRSFDSLPAETREKFRNDPSEMLDFVADPKNADEARKLGLLSFESREVESSPEPKERPKTKKIVEPSGPDSTENDSGEPVS